MQDRGELSDKDKDTSRRRHDRNKQLVDNNTDDTPERHTGHGSYSPFRLKESCTLIEPKPYTVIAPSTPGLL